MKRLAKNRNLVILSSMFSLAFLIAAPMARAEVSAQGLDYCFGVGFASASCSTYWTWNEIANSQGSDTTSSRSVKQRKTLMLEAAPQAAIYDGDLAKLPKLNAAVKTLQLENAELTENQAVEKVLTEAADAR